MTNADRGRVEMREFVPGLIFWDELFEKPF